MNCVFVVVVKVEFIFVFDELVDVVRENCGEEGSCVVFLEFFVMV